MKRMRNIWVILLLALVAAVGCQRRPLETVHRSTVRVIVKCIWHVDVYPEGEKPSGVTLYFFRDGQFYNTVTTSNVDSCEVNLEKGHYKMYMISQSPEEYWKMEFLNMTNYSDAATTLRENSMPWVTSTRADNEVTVENPEILYAGVADEFDITESMTEEYQYYYTTYKRQKQALLAKQNDGMTKLTKEEEELAYYEEKIQYYTIRIPIYPENVVSQFWITIYSGNADVLKSVRASTSGMAKTYDITRATTDKDEAIQVINQWTLTMDDAAKRVGHVDGIINTFGLPNGEKPNALRDPTLNVSALLIDNVTVADYVFQTGDKIEYLPPNPGYKGLYRLIFGSVAEPAITPPDVKPPDGSGGGFVADVCEWDEEVNADIQI